MKIKYVHSAAPRVEKIHDTEKSLKGCAGFLNAMGSQPTQKEWDEQELKRFEQDKAKGLILSYSAVDEPEEQTGSSRFDQLCEDFDRRRPSEPPVKRTFWFKTKWENGRDSVNDLLRRFLIDNAMEYLNTFNGDVWFIRDGSWCRCDYEVSGDTVRFYLCEFTEN